MTDRSRTVDEDARRATTASGATSDESASSSVEPHRGLSGSRKVIVAAVCVLSAALIAVSAAFLFQPAEQPEATPSYVVVANDEEASDQDEHVSDERDGDTEAKKADNNKEEPTPGAAEAEGERDAEINDGPAPAPSPSSGAASSSGGSGKSSSGSSGGGSSSSESGSSDGGAPVAPERSATVTVTVSVDSSAAGSPVSGGTTVTFEQGATAYDALMACGLSVNASNSPYGVYVSAIGGLAEGEHGGSSGWKYAVNGSEPSQACSTYVLHDGDTVTWRYALSANG